MGPSAHGEEDLGSPQASVLVPFLFNVYLVLSDT